jgi:biopolymer transport protein ExbD
VRKKREQLTPDLTPLIDVIFLLLIFFMVTSVFKKEELALMLNLPVAKENKESTKVEPKQITIELTKNSIAYNGKVINFEYLKKEAQKVKDKQKAIIVRIDEKVEYQRVVTLLDILQKNRLQNLSLVTKK